MQHLLLEIATTHIRSRFIVRRHTITDRELLQDFVNELENTNDVTFLAVSSHGCILLRIETELLQVQSAAF